MVEADRFHLKWEVFPSTITSKLSTYKESGIFCDVTLACEDEREIKAHKVVLSASSPFFERVLKRSDHSHPWIYLAGVNSKELELILQFIYEGETQVAEPDMVRFLKKANQMEIQGLTGWNNGLESKTEKKSGYFSESVHGLDSEPVMAPECIIDETDVEMNMNSSVHIKDEPADKTDHVNGETIEVELEGYPQEAEEEYNGNSDNMVVELEGYLQEEYKDNEISENIENKEPRPSLGEHTVDDDIVKEDGVFMCRLCGKKAKTRQNIRMHVEIHSQGKSYPCTLCEKCYKTKNSLNFHVSKAHRSKVQ